MEMVTDKRFFYW